MGQKAPEIDWSTYIETLFIQADIDSAMAQMEGLTSRELYCMDSQTNVAKYLIKRPSEYSMHGAITNYPLDPVEVVEDILIDGEVLYKVDDWQHIRKDDYVYRSDIDHWTGEVIYVLTCYPIDEGRRYYWQSWMASPSIVGMRPTCWYTQYYTTTDNKEETVEKLQAEYTIELPFMPWVRGAWKHGMGILEDVKTAIIRLEALYRIVSVTNNEGRRNYVTGVDSVKKIQQAPHKFGHSTFILPQGGDFKFPPSDEAGMQLLKDEKEWLWDGIEKSTGVVSVDKLTVLSGESRTIAEKPLMILAEDIRTMFNNLLSSMYNLIKFQAGTPEPEISYKPLTVAPQFETPEKLVEVLDKALEKKAISDDEWKQKIRYVLDLDSNQ
jgi:hypothetical protein